MFKIVLFCLVGSALCQVQQVIDSVEDSWAPGRINAIHTPVQIQESPAARFLGLSSGASQTVPNIRTSFSCIGRRYGYFADVDNHCQIFHVCQPSVNALGAPVIYHYSKFCPQNTRFDQKALTCVQETNPEILPCRESIRFYPIAESRFAEVPVIQRGVFEQVPEQFIEQRHDAINIAHIPTKNIQVRAQAISNVVPAKTIVRNVQPIVQQPIVQQTLVHQPAPLVTRKVSSVVTPVVQSAPIGQTFVRQQLVSPIVSHFRKVNPVPVASVHQGIPVQYLTQSQPLPSAAITQPIAQTIAQPVVQQTFGQPLVQQRGVNIIQTPGVQQIVSQPIPHGVEQVPQYYQSVQQPIPVQQPITQQRYEYIPQQPIYAQQPIQYPQSVQSQPLTIPQPQGAQQPQPFPQGVEQPQTFSVPQPVDQPQPVSGPQPVEQPEVVPFSQPVDDPQPLSAPRPQIQSQPLTFPQPVEQPQPVSAPQAPQPVDQPQPQPQSIPQPIDQRTDNVQPVNPPAQPAQPVPVSTNPQTHSSNPQPIESIVPIAAAEQGVVERPAQTLIQPAPSA